ncbi:hypothetical protein SELMODRAFT_132764 [Selaginella moellendorffii]|uniref:Pentacotripeptide-repeat region of PRORP domain-containing protein n=1 Tax=Selaginella moellendorffii TaxID=88036 RepID=D8T5L9_SELML|nr:hypothetical protein SELMODRAFT_132764 [Selaginella moellendorffii]
MPVKDVISWTAMVVAFSEGGNIDQAKHFFDQMITRDLVAWNSMIKAFANTGLLSDALGFLYAMLQEGIKPNDHTYRGILSGCSHAGLPEECRIHFLSMVADHAIAPELDHYCCVVDSLGRSKRLDWAEELVQSMPYVPNEVAWTSLLGACRVYGDAELLERAASAAREVSGLKPEDSSAYVMLANLIVCDDGSLDQEEENEELA